MREFFEAGGRSYEAYLEVCKERRDKIGSKTNEDQVITSSQTMTQFTRGVTADNYVLLHCGNSPKVRSNRTEQSQAAKSAATVFDFSSADDKSLAMTSPEVSAAASLPKTSGKSSTAVATSGQQCLTSEIIDKVIAVGLKTPLSELPRFSAACKSLAKDDAEFPAAPHSAASPSLRIASLTSAGSPVFSGLVPPVNFSASIAPLSSDYGEDDVFRSPSFCVPGKRRCPFEGHQPCAIDLSCKRQKPEADDQRETITPPDDSLLLVQSTLDDADDRANRSGSAPRVTSYAQSATIFSDVTRWSVEQVARYVASIPGCRDYAETFRQEQIDGACLIRLTERHLLGVIKMKLGPAIRLLQSISSLCMNTWTSSSEIPSSSSSSSESSRKYDYL